MLRGVWVVLAAVVLFSAHGAAAATLLSITDTDPTDSSGALITRTADNGDAFVITFTLEADVTGFQVFGQVSCSDCAFTSTLTNGDLPNTAVTTSNLSFVDSYFAPLPGETCLLYTSDAADE